MADRHQKIRIKLNYPQHWNFFKSTLPALFDLPVENTEFEINNNCIDCDVWIVWGNIDKAEKVRVPFSHTIFIAEEAYPEKKYPDSFLKQFAIVYGTRDDIVHPGFIRKPYTGTWFVNKAYKELLAIEPENLKKENELSVISSNLTMLDGHKKRYAFVNRLIGHFKDRLDVYGRGYQTIDDKAEGLLPFKYSIAIENSVIKDYFTEKIWDCYLSYTMPIYYGCPNIEDYFSAESLIRIDINDYKKSIAVIEEAIETDRYSKAFDSIKTARDLVLNKYTIIPFILDIISTVNKNQHERIQLVIVKPLADSNLNNSLLSKFKRLAKEIIIR